MREEVVMNRCGPYLVSDIVESGKIGKLHVGDDQEDICQEIKGFVLNPMRTSKKSKIFLDTYENIMFLLENKKIICMQINFENRDAKSVVLNDLFSEFSSIDDWLNFAEKYDWLCEKNSSVYVFRKNNVFIYVNDQGMLHLISVY
jgi:hypothetical protein